LIIILIDPRLIFTIIKIEKILELNLDEIFDENGYKNNIEKYKYDKLKHTKIKLYRTKDTQIIIGGNFLFNCANISSLDLTSLSNITQIGDFFLSNCSNITSLDLTHLSNLTQIGIFFLYGCSNIKEIIFNNDINNNIKNDIKNNIELNYRGITIKYIDTKKIWNVGEIYLNI
jgi:hypothetical protein